MCQYSLRALLAPPALALGLLATATSLRAQGAMRDLSCRGNTGMVLRVDQDPSPRDTAYVTMVLEYQRPTRPPGNDLRNLEPGTCTWNPLGHPAFPVEPGRVRFDVLREAQPWSATGTRIMDTTYRAAVFRPDPITLPRYLLDPRHYWRFYVNDLTNVSSSFGALFESGTPTYVQITGPVIANAVRRDLLCRGGTSGLLYGGGASVGNNLAKVQLTYRVSPNVPGTSGSGLAPGSCAWTSRTAMPAEPGKIWFITASNAQLRQTQSGVPLDRSPTAAERYPDVRSIPVYLEDPARYWTFSVTSRDPDSALTHGPWKRDLTTVVAGARTTTAPTTRSQPSTTGPGSQVFRPGAAGATSRVNALFDIKEVTVTPSLESAIIRFEAAPNIKPTVTLTPVAGGAPIQLAVGGTSIGTLWRYVATGTTKLARNTQYNYVISAPASANARANQKSGQFKTLGQRVTVAFTEIYLVMDGDADDDGELEFEAETCPRYQLKHLKLGNAILKPLSWGDGRHRIDEKMTSYGDSAPDRFRVTMVGFEYDEDHVSGTTPGPNWTSFCVGDGVQPGSTSDWVWNSVMLDFDLTKYPGTKGGEQFYRRSKALRNGSNLSFEVRGYIEVTRQ